MVILKCDIYKSGLAKYLDDADDANHQQNLVIIVHNVAANNDYRL